jgi:hypothetical protein
VLVRHGRTPEGALHSLAKHGQYRSDRGGDGGEIQRSGRRSSCPTCEVREAGGAATSAAREVDDGGTVKSTTTAEERDAVTHRGATACRGRATDDSPAVAGDGVPVGETSGRPMSVVPQREATRLEAGQHRGSRGTVEVVVLTRPMKLRAEMETHSHR